MPISLIIGIALVVLIVLGIAIFPAINKKQFKNMPYDQQIRILMKQAKGLTYFKNISNGSKGTLVYVKNKRKILFIPWVLMEGKMVCTKENLFEKWDYPEEKPVFTQDEIDRAKQELQDYNKKNPVKLIFKEN